MADEKEGFIDPKIKEYSEKKKNTPYQNDGTITYNSTEDNNAIDNFNISFSGQSDHANNYIAQDVSLNYSEDVTFPISYRKADDIVGLQTKYVGSKYVAINKEGLENQTYEGIEDLYEISNSMEKFKKLAQLPFTEQELKQLQETYRNVLSTSLQDSQFTKVEENNSKGYKLTLNGEQLQEVTIQLLETLKNDQATLDKLSEYIKEQKNSAKITANTIENIIKDIKNDTNVNDKNSEITVYQEKGKMTKLVVMIEQVKIQLEKKKTADDLFQYMISIETTNNNKVSLTANYTGLETMQNINESYELEIKPGEGIFERAIREGNQNELATERELVTLLVSNTKANNLMNNKGSTITADDLEETKREDTTRTYDNIEIEQSNNTIRLTFTDTKDEFKIDDTGKIIEEPEKTNANFNTTDNNISYQYQYNNQINFVTTVTAEEFSDENAMILNNYEEEQVNNFLQQVKERIKMVNSQQMEELGLKEDENPFGQMLTSILKINIYNQATSVIKTTGNSMNELEVNSFNQKFENYESTNLQGVTVKGLLSTIQLNNETQDEDDRKIKEIHFDGEEYEVTDQNILLLKGTVEIQEAYRVEFERDEETGLIYRAVINKK